MTTRKIFGYGFLAVILALAFVACSGGGGKSLNSTTELKEYLDKQPANSPDQPIKIAMKANDMMIGEIVGIIKSANKYVSLNLSGSPLTEIPQRAFKDCKTLVGITIPNSVTSIGEEAFRNTGLTSITIPNNITSIENNAFSGTGLTSVTFAPNSQLKNISGFSGCTSLTSITIPNSVTDIQGRAFERCTSLTSVTIPNSVISIGSGSFLFCDSLTIITVDSSNPNFTSEGGILYNKAKAEIVFVPKGISGNVTIPNGVTKITDVFSGTGLTNVTIPSSVISIGNIAFSKCTSLTSVTIPNSVTSIGEGAFSDCTSLASVTIPNSVTSIGHFAFSGCTSLTSVTFQGTISSSNLGGTSPFPGDLRSKYLAGGPGTYTRDGNTWTKQ